MFLAWPLFYFFLSQYICRNNYLQCWQCGQPSMRRLPLSTENLPAGMAFLLLRLHICSFARDAAAVQAARGLRAVRVALTGVVSRAI